MINATSNKYSYMTLLYFVLAATLSFSVQADANKEPNVNNIIAQANLAAFYSGNDGRSQARMIIVDNQGRKQMRQFTILRNTLEKAGDQQMMVFFSRPSDVRGTVFRVEKKIIEGDDRWLYLPGLDLLRRISSGDKRTSFVGSHFFYEDISGRNIQDDKYTLINESTTHYLIEATPKDASTVEFSRFQVSIDKVNSLPTTVEYFDKNNTLYRKVSAITIKDINGFPTVVRSKVEDIANGGYTTLELKNVTYDIGYPSSVFSERSMRTPPTQYLR
jgi:hypothetical protein